MLNPKLATAQLASKFRPQRRIQIQDALLPEYADWGGMLQFLDETGHVEETHFPMFNSLTLFEVPMWHSVSYVVPYAKNARYAITGWAMSH